MPTAQKSAEIEELEQAFGRAASIFLADFTGLNVEELTRLRRKCRENGVELRVVKNTLAVKASRKASLEALVPHFRGPTALAIAVEDPTSPARVLVDFRKEHDEKPEVKLGFVDGQLLTPEQVKAFAALPTREQLISQVMQLALAPAQGFVGVLNEILAKLVRTVDAVRAAKEEGRIASAMPPPPKAEAEQEGSQRAESE
jgi:large subunit ribosomal protein L10